MMDSPPPIDVVLGDSAPGELLRVDQNRIQVRFELAAAPLIALGSQLPVALQLPLPASTFDCEGRVLLRADEPESRVYGIDLDTNIEQFLQKRSGRRSAYRVTLSEKDPLTVTIRRPDRQRGLRGELEDVSVLGLSIRIDTAAERELLDAEEVQIRFQLPELPTPMDVTGVIRNRYLRTGSIQLGIALDFEKTEDAGSVEQALTDFVMGRQLEELRRRAGSRHK